MAVGTFNPPEPITKWLSVPNKNDRDMELREDFTFTDSNGVIWSAPKGSRVNGANIPSGLWSTIGSPFTGAYRRASIVHDVACVKAHDDADRLAADDMFFDACLAGGCSRFQANTLYAGVRIGAWWSPPSSLVATAKGVKAAAARPREPAPDEALKIFKSVQKKLGDRMRTATREEINALVAAAVNKAKGIKPKSASSAKAAIKKKQAKANSKTATSSLATKKATVKKK